jgi:phospholipase C
MNARISLTSGRTLFSAALVSCLALALLVTGCAGNVTGTSNPASNVSITANPTSIAPGSSSTLTVAATDATLVVIAGSDGSTYTLSSIGGTKVVTPTVTTIYTATATGTGGIAAATATVTVTSTSNSPTVSISASPASITPGSSSTLTVTATNATQVTVTGDGKTYSLAAIGGTQAVSPAATTTYTATATGAGGSASATATVTVGTGSGVQSIKHVIFMLQENHTFDNYFGMLNPYRQRNKLDVGDDGVTYNVDGIDDKLKTISNDDDEGTSFPLFKLTSTCIDDDSSDWLASYGSVNRYDFTTTRQILMDGFVHTAEGYDKSCALSGICSGVFTKPITGELAMGYYDEGFLNYYYYMASQFAVSDRWFSPMASKSIDNRIATFTGGTTQGLVKDPGGDDHLSQLSIPNIFEALDTAGVSWRVYYTVNQGFCLKEDDCAVYENNEYPATDFSNLQYSFQYLHDNPTPGVAAGCKSPTQPSSVVGDLGDSFCIDLNHVAPISTYFSDLTNGTLPSFAFIEAGYGNNDEHPGSGQSILEGQAQVASVVNEFMISSSWKDSVFFFSYDEGGGPYDHVPPVPDHSNQYTDTTTLGAVPPDIKGIAVKPDGFNPCVPATPGTPTLHCDLASTDPGATLGDAAYKTAQGLGAQLGFRLPNIIISPFTRKHYVSHTPMDHTAVIRFVEDTFIKNSKYLTNRDAAQPDLLEFFDFTGIPWATPPTPPTPLAAPGNCKATTIGG